MREGSAPKMDFEGAEVIEHQVRAATVVMLHLHALLVSG